MINQSRDEGEDQNHKKCLISSLALFVRESKAIKRALDNMRKRCEQSTATHKQRYNPTVKLWEKELCELAIN
jgi:hypothetical protein